MVKDSDRGIEAKVLIFGLPSVGSTILKSSIRFFTNATFERLHPDPTHLLTKILLSGVSKLLKQRREFFILIESFVFSK